MSLRDEQYNAIQRTRNFLRTLLNLTSPKGVQKEIRDTASSCLKHYPFQAEDGSLMFSQDPFGPDLPPRQTERCMLELLDAVKYTVDTLGTGEDGSFYVSGERFNMDMLKTALEHANDLVGETDKYAKQKADARHK